MFYDSFKKCVITNNGGRPSKQTFDTNKVKGRELKSFLSFNKDDKETVWKVLDWHKDELSDKYVPFCIDNFGNLICFDASNDRVIFLNHENTSIEMIADGFDEFMNGLYSVPNVEAFGQVGLNQTAKKTTILEALKFRK